MSYTPLLGHWYSVVCPVCYNDVVFECRTLYNNTITCNACHSCIDLCKVVETENKTSYDVCTDSHIAPVKYSNEVVNVGRNSAAEIALSSDNNKYVNKKYANSIGNGTSKTINGNAHSRESAMTNVNSTQISQNDHIDSQYCNNIDNTSQQHYKNNTKSKNGATCSAGGSAAMQLAMIMNDVDREVAQVLPERVSEEVHHTFLAQRQRSIMDFFNFLSFITHALERVIFVGKPVLVIGHVRIYRKRFVCSSLEWSKVQGNTNNFTHEENGNGISHRVEVQSNISSNNNNSHQNSSNKKFNANDEANNFSNGIRNHTH